MYTLENEEHISPLDLESPAPYNGIQKVYRSWIKNYKPSWELYVVLVKHCKGKGK